MTVTHRKRKEKDVGGMKYHCDHCKRDITNTIRVRCCECVDFDLCIECFSRGVEVNGHLNSHSYRLLDKYAFPLLDVEWGADEEWLLIEAIDMYGLGNWQDIADHVGTKTLSECESHYLRYYINSKKYPLPDLDVQLDPKEIRKARVKRQATPVKSHTILPPYKSKVQPSCPANHEIQGYMAGRLEFDVEHENEAEMMVKDMIFAPDETSTDIDLKLAVLDIYNSKLDRRMQRKKFIFDRNYIEFRRTQISDRKRSREEKEVIGRTKMYSRVMTNEDYSSFVEGLVLEKSLRDKISLLQEYRRNGIKTFKDGEVYQQEKKNRIMALSKSPFASTEKSINSRPSSSASPTPPMEANKPKMQQQPTPLDLQGCEGVDQLTSSEQALCSALRLFPRAYMAIKNVLIREAEKRGGLKRRDARTLVRIDVNKLGKIYDFFVRKSWI
eukprot:Partr_v1_DN25633_c0_g1_i1_m4793 putative Transcriptional